jgi:hypothetical protein
VSEVSSEKLKMYIHVYTNYGPAPNRGAEQHEKHLRDGGGGTSLIVKTTKHENNEKKKNKLHVLISRV